MDTFRQSSQFLDPIGFFLLIVSNLFFALIVLKHWKARILRILLLIAYPILCTISVVYVGRISNEPSAYVALFIVSMLSLLILTKARLEEAIFLSIFQLFHMIFAKGVVAGAMSLIYEKNMYQLFQVSQYEQLIVCFSHGVLVVLFCIYYLLFNKKKISAFFLCKGQVYYVMMIHIVLALYLLFKCYNFYFNLDLIWFSVEQVFTSITLYAVFFLVLRFGVRISSLLQNEIRKRNQEFKIMKQVANFEVLPEEAKAEINISKSKIINALFSEFKNICKSKNIALEIEGNISENINISEEDLHEVLSNLLKNSIEAVLKISEEKNRKITIKFEEIDKKFNVLITNTYNKKPRVSNGKLDSTKRYSEIEGLGIGYVIQVLEQNKGKFKFKIDTAQKMFNAEVSIKKNK